MLRWHSGRLHSPCKRDIIVSSNLTRSSKSVDWDSFYSEYE